MKNLITAVSDDNSNDRVAGTGLSLVVTGLAQSHLSGSSERPIDKEGWQSS